MEIWNHSTIWSKIEPLHDTEKNPRQNGMSQWLEIELHLIR